MSEICLCDIQKPKHDHLAKDNRRMSRAKMDPTAFLRYYSFGYTDAELATALHRSISSVGWLRNRLKLTPNKREDPASVQRCLHCPLPDCQWHPTHGCPLKGQI